MPKSLMLFLAIAVACFVLSRHTLAEEKTFLTYDGTDGPGKGKNIVLISGDEEYRSEEALPELAAILAKLHGFHCTVLFEIDPKTGEVSPEQHNNIPGVDALDKADLLIILTRFR